MTFHIQEKKTKSTITAHVSLFPALQSSVVSTSGGRFQFAPTTTKVTTPISQCWLLKINANKSQLCAYFTTNTRTQTQTHSYRHTIHSVTRHVGNWGSDDTRDIPLGERMRGEARPLPWTKLSSIRWNNSSGTSFVFVLIAERVLESALACTL